MSRICTLIPGIGLRRETLTSYRGRPLVVVLRGKCLDIYPKGLPAARYTIAYD